ncbi:hypothetical protein [Lignipirellula cremea]|uniref:FtsH ternary system domain-containing protein n=1 Tax=Lignipirellula cremea TaxID=2528010 RepID=A0A518DSQ2_9BACT|nr:hypothetical protein [Lignipirellula cremea]QDU94866.1 hypothetical protein Pla8534_26740 [Lignipirellula cremea]
MLSLTRFEANLMHITHAVLQRAPVDTVLPLLLRSCPTPAGLSREAIDLLSDTLNKGVVRLLAHTGGWRKEKRLRGDKVQTGRIWECQPPQNLGLAFSGYSLQLLMALTGGNLGDAQWRWRPSGTPQSGDELLLFLAMEAFQETAVGDALRRQQAVQQHALCRLAFPGQFADLFENDEPNDDDAPRHGQEKPLRWAVWFSPPGVYLLECLQSRLAQHWIQLEQKKRHVTRCDAMRGLGAAQLQVLGDFWLQVEQADRRDLAGFLLATAQKLLQRQPTAGDWTASLDIAGLRIADRFRSYDAALAFLRWMPRFAAWRDRALAIGYWDEGYAAAQAWKAEWEEKQGDRLCETAAAMVQEREPLQV